MKYSQFHRIIRRNGWVCIRSRGSHYIYKKGNKTYAVANHGSKEMAEPTRLEAIKMMGLDLKKQ
ncbi:type II toxin-antitoxin system HicA family toxin [Dyadobacter crusticola]|uniref:type II toxin-antitoxin system HicA family toxin n=1 Tax=Dyadobacter crusticola TaxID=292407 RepID=UPI0004E1E319